MRHTLRHASTASFRNFIFGVEDSLVSTVGLISGIAIGGLDRQSVFLTGVVLIFVEAVSMAAGSYLSESSAAEYEKCVDGSAGGTWQTTAIMFFSYFFSGFIPLSPYMLMSVGDAFWVSIAMSLVFLFVLGIISANISGADRLRQGIKMFVVGGLAIAVGVIVGHYLKVQ